MFTLEPLQSCMLGAPRAHVVEPLQSCMWGAPRAHVVPAERKWFAAVMLPHAPIQGGSSGVSLLRRKSYSTAHIHQGWHHDAHIHQGWHHDELCRTHTMRVCIRNGSAMAVLARARTERCAVHMHSIHCIVRLLLKHPTSARRMFPRPRVLLWQGRCMS